MQEHLDLMRLVLALLALAPCSRAAASEHPAANSLEVPNHHRADYGLVQFEREGLRGPQVTFTGPSEQPATRGPTRRRRRRRRPRVQPPPSTVPLTAGSALHALEELVRADQLQCVPRLLCDALGAAAAPAALRRAAAAVSPLLEVVSAGGGVLQLARAALLGAGGEQCAPRYPACPQDPAQLQHYLNNHNGGLFRLFGVPPPPPTPPPPLHAPGYGLYSPDTTGPQQYGYYGSGGPTQSSSKTNDDNRTQQDDIERRIVNNSPNVDFNEVDNERNTSQDEDVETQAGAVRVRFPGTGAGGALPQLVYVVRGRGDPRYPEVLLLQPGQTLR